MESQSENPVAFIRFRMASTYPALVRQFTSIQKYPMLNSWTEPVNASELLAGFTRELGISNASEMSAHAAIIEDITMNINETKVKPVTRPSNQSTSPNAIRMMVKFLNIVYTGMLKNCYRFVQALGG